MVEAPGVLLEDVEELGHFARSLFARCLFSAVRKRQCYLSIYVNKSEPTLNQGRIRQNLAFEICRKTLRLHSLGSFILSSMVP